MDDFDLLRDPDGEPAGSGADPGDGRRRPWELLVALVLVALGSLAGIAWLISSVAGGDPVAAPAPATTSAVVVPTGTVPPSLSLPPTETVAATSRPPVPTASAVVTFDPAPTTRSPTPRPTTPQPPTPRPSTAPPTPRTVIVPDVVGLRLKTAMVTLEAAGFKVSVLGGIGPAPKPDLRRVAAQRPRGGSVALRGSIVVLVLDSI